MENQKSDSQCTACAVLLASAEEWHSMCKELVDIINETKGFMKPDHQRVFQKAIWMLSR